MLNIFLKFLGANWQAVVIALMAVTIHFGHVEIAELRKDKTQLQSDIDRVTADAKLCSDGVADLKSKGDAMQRSLDAAQQTAAQDRARTAGVITSILSQKVPSDCAGAMKDLVVRIKDPAWRGIK